MFPGKRFQKSKHISLASIDIRQVSQAGLGFLLPVILLLLRLAQRVIQEVEISQPAASPPPFGVFWAGGTVVGLVLGLHAAVGHAGEDQARPRGAVDVPCGAEAPLLARVGQVSAKKKNK